MRMISFISPDLAALLMVSAIRSAKCSFRVRASRWSRPNYVDRPAGRKRGPAAVP